MLREVGEYQDADDEVQGRETFVREVPVRRFQEESEEDG